MKGTQLHSSQMHLRPIYLLLCFVSCGGVRRAKTDVPNNMAGHSITYENTLYRGNELKKDSNTKMFFVEEPKKEYYLVKNKAAIIRCSVLNAKFMNIKCVGQWLNPQIMSERVREVHGKGEGDERKAETASEIDSETGNNFRTQPNEVLTASVRVSKNDLKDFVDPLGYWCECYAWSHSPTPHPDHHVIKSSRAIVHNAYMRRYFEREPLSTSVEVGGTVQLECLPPPGMPPPEVVWMKGTRKIEPRNDANYIISNEGNLIIVQARLSDADNYTCVAQNVAFKLPSDQARVVVYVDEKWSSWSACSDRCSQSRRKRCTQKVPVQAGMYCVQDWQEWRLCGTHSDVAVGTGAGGGGAGGGGAGGGGAGSGGAGGGSSGGGGDNSGGGGNGDGGGNGGGLKGVKNGVPSLCPVGLWSEWSSWSSCSSDCIQHKKRFCNNGNNRTRKERMMTQKRNKLEQSTMRDIRGIKNENSNIYEPNDAEEDRINNIIKKKHKGSNSYFINNENKNLQNNHMVNNHTDYCVEYELEMRNCTIDSCFMKSDYQQQNEITKTMVVITIIIIATAFVVLFIFIISYRFFTNKSNLWDKDVHKTKVVSASSKNEGTCVSMQKEKYNSNQLNYDAFKIDYEANNRRANENLTQNKQLVTQNSHNNDFSKNNFLQNCSTPLFGSYKQRIKLKMLKKLLKQKNLLYKDNEIKHLNESCGDREGTFSNDDVGGESDPNIENFNKITSKATNSSSSSNSHNNDSLYNKKQYLLSISPSTSLSTTNSNKRFTKPHQPFDPEARFCGDVTLWKRIDNNGGKICFEKLGVSLSVPRGAFEQEHYVYLSLSRLNRLQLKGTQTLLSSVVLCGFEGKESTFHKAALIKLRHNALSVDSNQWLFTLFKFNQSDSLETNHLEPAFFSLDDEYCYITDHVLSGYALIGQPSSSCDVNIKNGQHDGNLNNPRRSSSNNNNIDSNNRIHTNVTSNEDLFWDKKQVKTKGGGSGGSVRSGDSENNYDIILMDHSRLPPDTVVLESPAAEEAKVASSGASKLATQSNNLYSNLSTEGSFDVCKMLKVIAFFPTTVNSKEIIFKIYFIDDNPDSFEYAVEMERSEGYSILGKPHNFPFHFQRGGDVLVTLKGLDHNWSSPKQQQEIPFGHLWNNHQMNFHCSFSLHHLPNSPLQQFLQRHTKLQHLQLKQQKHTDQQHYQQLTFNQHPSCVQDNNHFTEQHNSTTTRQSDSNLKQQKQKSGFPEVCTNNVSPQHPLPCDRHVHTNYFPFSCTILIKQQHSSESFTEFPVEKQCYSDHLSALRHINNHSSKMMYNSGCYDGALNTENKASCGGNYQGMEAAQQPNTENIYNSVYDKASNYYSDQSISKQDSINSHSLLTKLLSTQLDSNGWRELASLMGMERLMGYFETTESPAKALLDSWHANFEPPKRQQLPELIGYLKVMHRTELIETVQNCFKKEQCEN